MDYLKDSFDTGQTEDGFLNSKSIYGYRSSYSLPLFRKESTSELTAKTKESDRISTTQLGLSQSLIVQKATDNNVTLKGYPKKFCGLFGQKAHKTHQMILFHHKRGGLSLALRAKGRPTTLNISPRFKQ